MKKNKISELYSKYYIPVWTPPADFVPERGDKEYIIDKDGERYIDFVTGIAVNALGYNYSGYTKIIERFAQSGVHHVSSLFLQEDRIKLAELLVKKSFADRVFFGNSGTEAVEGAIKFARKYAYTNFGSKKNQIISFSNGFHGRTYGALAATAQKKFHKGFGPMPSGYKYLPLNDIDVFKKNANEKTVCAVIVEPIQIEGGIIKCDKKWIKEVRKICNERNILLILDEVQTGVGRLGTLWGYQKLGVTPDIMTLAKALGGGIPFGAVLMKEKIAKSLSAGDHGNTTGGSPIAAALGIEILNKISTPKFMDEVNSKSKLLMNGLKTLQKKYPDLIEDVKGEGMVFGLALKNDLKSTISACRENGLIVCSAGGNVLRLLPQLNVRTTVIKKAINILDGVFNATRGGK